MATLTKKALDAHRKQAEFVKQVRSQFEAYHDTSSTFRSKLKDDFNFMVGGDLQWDPNDRERLRAEQRPRLTFNAIHPLINFLSGYQIEREQDFRAFPRGSEDEHIGRIATALLTYAMDQCDGREELCRQFRQGIIGGLSVMEVAHTFERVDDLLEGECVLTCLPENTWYCDPFARRYDRQDAAYQGKLFWMGQEEAQGRWKRQAERLKVTADWIQYDPSLTGVPEHIQRELIDVEHRRLRILQHWYRVPVDVVVLVNRAEPDPARAVQRMESEEAAEEFLKGVRDRAGAQLASAFQIIKSDTQHGLMNVVTGDIRLFPTQKEAEQALSGLKSAYGKQAVAPYQRVERQATALRVAHLTGWELLSDEPRSDPHNWRYPFVPFLCFQDTDDLDAIKGLIRDQKDPQREINWHHSTMLDTMQRGSKGQTWLNKADNANLEKLKQQISKAGFIGEYVTQPPIYLPPASFSPGDLAMMEIALDAMMRGTGLTAELLGQTTQKTVSGRAIGARQAGGLVGTGSLFQNWMRSKRLVGELLVREIQQYYSVEKMDRVIGQEQRLAEAMGILGRVVLPPAELYARFKRLKDIDFDIKIDFQEAAPTAREAVSNRLMQLMAAGFPIPPDVILEASNVPFKEEIKAALSKQGMGAPNEGLSKVLSASQGAPAQPMGVNANG